MGKGKSILDSIPKTQAFISRDRVDSSLADLKVRPLLNYI